MARLLLTGATGWVGGALARELLRRGHELTVLVRTEEGAARLCAQLGLSADAVVLGEVSSPLAGLGAHAHRLGGIDGVVHLAAAVRLDATQGTLAELQRVNVDGTRHIIELASAIAAPTFCLMSSCSIAGDAQAFDEDDLDVGQRFRNEYERTKLEAERVVSDFGGRRMILRMPALVGDSRTGETGAFWGAFYAVAAAYSFLRQELADEWAHGDRAGLSAEGVRFDDEGVLHLPIHVPYRQEPRCEIVPQDWLVEVAADLIGHPEAHGTFHLLHPRAPSLGWMIESCLRHLRIAPPAPSAPGDGRWTRLVRRTLDRLAGEHYPYLQGTARMSTTHFDRWVQRPAPPMDAAFVARLLDYAASHGFGA